MKGVDRGLRYELYRLESRLGTIEDDNSDDWVDSTNYGATDTFGPGSWHV